MSRDEALDLLGLDPSAKPAQIKEAYKDLVKVWHPDRFGSDPRLRQKAETKLAALNEAYRILQDPRTSQQPQTQPPTPRSPSHPKRPRPSRTLAIPRRLYPSIALAILFLIGYLALRYFASRPATPTESPIPDSPTPVVVQQPSESPKPASAHLHSTHRQSPTVESICAPIKNLQGNAAYIHCLEQHLTPAKNPPQVPSDSTDNDPRH